MVVAAACCGGQVCSDDGDATNIASRLMMQFIIMVIM